jgi:signal peptidase I
MTTQEFADVEALRQQCTRIIRLAAEALTRAIQRRDAVRSEVRLEEERLASVTARRRIAEASLNSVRDQLKQRIRELEALRATQRPLARAQPTPLLMRTVPAMVPAVPPSAPITVADVLVTSVGVSAAPVPADRMARRRLPALPRTGLYRHIPTGLLSVLLFGLALLLTPVSQLVGWEVFAVLSGSMEPTIKVGGIVAVHPVPADQLKIGDVITFVDQNRPDTFVTHRIVELSVTDGQVQAKTKGDANDTADAWNVPASKAVGRVDLALPYLGYLMVWLSSPLAKVAILGIAVLGLAVPSVQRRPGSAAQAVVVASIVKPPAPAPVAAPAPVVGQARATPAGKPTFDELEREIQQMLGDQNTTQHSRAA